MIREKLANEITSAAREKLASWEKKWILSRRKQGLPEPTIGDLDQLMAESGYRGAYPSRQSYNSLTHGYDDSASEWNRAQMDAAFKRSNRIKKLIKSKNFSPKLLKKYDKRIQRLINSPFHENWTEGFDTKRRLSLFMQGSPRIQYLENTASLREKMQDIGNRQRELVKTLNFLEQYSQPLTRLIKDNPARDKFFKAWSLQKKGTTPDFSEVITSSKSIGIPEYIRERFKLIDESSTNPDIFISGRPEVSAGYLRPGELFQVGDYRHIKRNDPFAFFSQHLAIPRHIDRLKAKLYGDPRIAGGNKGLGQLHNYETVTQLENILSDPASGFFLTTKKPKGKLGPQQLLNRTKAISIPKLQEVAPKLQKLLRGLANKPLRF